MGVGTHRHFVENSSLNAPIHLKFIWKTILHQNLQQMILFFSNSDQYALPPLLAHLCQLHVSSPQSSLKATGPIVNLRAFALTPWPRLPFPRMTTWFPPSPLSHLSGQGQGYLCLSCSPPSVPSTSAHSRTSTSVCGMG